MCVYCGEDKVRCLNNKQPAHMTYHRHGIDEPQEVVLEESHVTANDSPAEHKTHTHTLSLTASIIWYPISTHPTHMHDSPLNGCAILDHPDISIRPQHQHQCHQKKVPHLPHKAHA